MAGAEVAVGVPAASLKIRARASARRWASVRFADGHTEGASEMATAFATMFQLFFVRLVIFFGCFGIFTYLVRGELAERSLHFYLLAPIRREVFLAGKFVAGVLAGWALFGASLLLQLGFAFLPGATAAYRWPKAFLQSVL